MADREYKYIIVGGGLAGSAAVDGIRQIDRDGAILLVGAENHLPYDRPPLTKQLWFGKKQVEQIFVHDAAFYAGSYVEVMPGRKIVGLDPQRKTVADESGQEYHYDKLLLATGGAPRMLDAAGGDDAAICYYRYLNDYLRVRAQAQPGTSAVVIGAGFIGSEIAAALNVNQVQVTLIHPHAYLVPRVFPEGLGRALQELYISRGITVHPGDVVVLIERRGGKFFTRTRAGAQIESDLAIVGVGIVPAVELAGMAGLALDNGIVVNELLQTSHPDIYAAGDNAFFPYTVLGQRMRVEHWDNAINQGKWAGRNMAGAGQPYTHMPYFYSDLFEFGYEAVGEVDSRLDIFADWQQEDDTGVIYYLRDRVVRGAMMCNVWEKVEAARELIRQGRRRAPDELRGAIG